MQESYRAAGLILKAEAANDPALRQRFQALAERKPLVISGQHDHIDVLFKHLGILYELVNWERLGEHDLTPSQPVFINCGSFTPSSRDLEMKLHDYVEQGGILTTTDWCLKYVLESVFPGFVRSTGEKTEAENESFPIQVDPSVNIEAASWFVERSSFPLEIMAKEKVKALFTSREFGDKYHCDPSLAVIFPIGQGMIIHYVSHLYAQLVEIRNAQDASSSIAYAQEKGIDPAVLGELGNKTRTAGVRSAYSAMSSVIYTSTQSAEGRTKPVGGEPHPVRALDHFTLLCEEPVFKREGVLRTRATLGPLEKELIIGREGPVDLIIEAETVSRRHAGLLAQGTAVYIRDLASSNGTYVNKEKVTEPRQLFYKDQIQLGECPPLRVEP